jgi:isoleucyl-tRNA synthetase
VSLSAEEVVVTETPRTGWAVASGAGETVALDLEITPELRRAGLVREAVRLVQDARKSSGLEVSDRIELWWQASGELAEALEEGSARLADEVLAVRVEHGTANADVAVHADADLGLSFQLRVAGA